jgi:gliding motility-associated-like protein
VSGNGERDNKSFVILDNQVVARKSFDFEDQSLYSIRVKTTDVLGATFEKVFEIQVEDVNEAPVILLEQQFTVYEDEAPNFNVGQVLVEDQDDQNFNFSILENQVPFMIDSITGDLFIGAIGLDFEKEDFYELTILAEDSGGLSDINSIRIVVLDVIEAELPVNNFISDNGDGKNDVFFIQNVNLYSEYILSIFNSSGVLVYRAENYSNNWSGKALNGKLLPEGVYYYVFSAPDAQGFKGVIILVR